MTARTTTLVGVDAGAYYVQAQLGYYVDPSEPSGRWHGHAASRLGLDGDVDVDDFLALMAGLRPATDELLGTRHTGRTVRGFDVTCSAPKSASVLFAVGGAEVRAEVLAAHDDAVSAVVGWVEAHAHVRYRVGGQVCAVDAEGIVAAVFRQHTSRALDPQLHSHVVIVNRAWSPDGRWLALDARTIKRDQQTLSRLYHAGLRAELTRRLGVAWREPVNGIAEMADMPDDVLTEFSKRAGQVETRVDAKLDRFEATMERPPTPRERWRLEREAVLDSRPAKTHADAATLEVEWATRLADLGVTPERLVGDAVGVEAGVGRIDAAAEQAIVERALSALGVKQSTWRPAELVRELAAAVPTNITVPADRLGPWLDQAAEQVIEERMVDLSRPIPDGVPVRRDGRPITEGAVDRILSLPEIVAQEERLLALAERRLALGGTDHVVEDTTGELTGPQRQLATAVAGDRQLVLAIGPAGTGKTTALRPAVEQLRREGRAVFGVAPSAAAAEVLAVDTGVDADTLDKLLVEHSLDRRPQHRYDLPPGATLIVDEAAMVPTARLAQLVELADRRVWRLALVGDPLQFAAVGRSGMFGNLVNTHGAIELDRVHRFSNAWERDASLRLRKGDTAVIDLYQEHGRLHGGTQTKMRRAVVDAWWDATERGETAAMMAPTNTAVIALNVEVQRRRLAAGDLDPKRKTINVGPYAIRVGDLVATRRNERKLVTDRNQMVKNRDHWTVTAVHRDNSLSVIGKTGTVRLPNDYVAGNVELVYAETSHANQGRTVDRSYLYLDAPTGAAGIYVPLTRGRQSNEAFVVTCGEQTPADVIGEALSRTWIDRPAVEVRSELRRRGSDDVDGSRTGPEQPLARAELRRLLERDAELSRTLERGRRDKNAAQSRVAELANKRVSLGQTIKENEKQLAAARRTVEAYDRPLLRRRHRTDLDNARQQISWRPKSIDTDHTKLAALDDLERDAQQRLAQAAVVEKARPEMITERGLVRYKLDQDARIRGEQLAQHAELPDYMVKRIGTRTAARAAEVLWIDAAGRAEQHAVAFDATDTRGRRSRSIDDDAFDNSRLAARDAIERLDRALGRQPQIDPAHRDLGISR